MLKKILKKNFYQNSKKNHIKNLAQSIKDSNQDDFNLGKIAEKNPDLEYVAETSSNLIGSFESIGKSNYVVGAIANSKAGDVFGPLPTIRGQVFVRVIEIDEINSADFDEKKDSIKFSLLIQRQNMLWSNWLQALRDESELKDYRYDFY